MPNNVPHRQAVWKLAAYSCTTSCPTTFLIARPSESSQHIAVPLHAQQCLIIGHININSVRYKCIEMSDYLSENLLDVLFIAETKLDASFPSPQFHVDGFKLHRSDRNEHGGGIMAYVRCDLAHRRRTDLENVVVTPVESLVLEVVLRQEKWLFVCLYSLSNSAKKQCCDSISTIFDVTATECIAMPFIIGDLNINMSCPSDANNLKDVMDMHGLYNLVHEPTCFKGKTPSLIDVILTCNVKEARYKIIQNDGFSWKKSHAIILLW